MSKASGKRDYSYTEAVKEFGNYLRDEDLVHAYKRLGSSFPGKASKMFLVLKEEKRISRHVNLSQSLLP
jgi:hypothetical protein